MNKNYIHNTEIHNPDSAKEIMPMIINLLKPKSIIDIGCGLGDWLFVAEKMGVTDYLGVDSPNVSKDKLYIPNEKFLVADLLQPLQINKKFDLAICLEVGEHLPETFAQTFVNTLTSLSDNILFSAAIPGQGGQNHVNEQPYVYWQKLFEIHGFYFNDILRSQLWGNKKIKWWYQQNIFLISKNQNDYNPESEIKIFIHPELFYKKIRTINQFNQGKESPLRYLNLFFKSTIIRLKKILYFQT